MKSLVKLTAVIVLSLCAHGADCQNRKQLSMEQVLAMGPEYDLIKTSVGVWNVEEKIWNDSSTTPMIVEHFVARRSFQGKFLEEIMEPVKGSTGQPFKRITYFNFNSATRQWEYIVVDTRYPLMMFENSVDPAFTNNKITLYLPAFVMPPGWIVNQGGQLARQRRVISFEGNDKIVMQQYWSLPAIREFMAIQYVYTRR